MKKYCLYLSTKYKKIKLGGTYMFFKNNILMRLYFLDIDYWPKKKPVDSVLAGIFDRIQVDHLDSGLRYIPMELLTR